MAHPSTLVVSSSAWRLGRRLAADVSKPPCLAGSGLLLCIMLRALSAAAAAVSEFSCSPGRCNLRIDSVAAYSVADQVVPAIPAAADSPA